MPGREPALGDELAVGVGNGVTGEPEIAASAREEGSAVPAASLPLRTASRSADSSAARGRVPDSSR